MWQTCGYHNWNHHICICVLTSEIISAIKRSIHHHQETEYHEIDLERNKLIKNWGLYFSFKVVAKPFKWNSGGSVENLHWPRHTELRLKVVRCCCKMWENNQLLLLPLIGFTIFIYQWKSLEFWSSCGVILLIRSSFVKIAKSCSNQTFQLW